jgi:hypothetical protein
VTGDLCKVSAPERFDLSRLRTAPCMLFPDVLRTRASVRARKRRRTLRAQSRPVGLGIAFRVNNCKRSGGRFVRLPRCDKGCSPPALAERGRVGHGLVGFLLRLPSLSRFGLPRSLADAGSATPSQRDTPWRREQPHQTRPRTRLWHPALAPCACRRFGARFHLALTHGSV